MDWLAFGLPAESGADGERTVGELLEHDVPTCRPDERLAAVAARLHGGWSSCPVVNEAGVVFGRVRRRCADRHPDTRAGELMEHTGTYRPSVPAAELLERMREIGVEMAVVTSSDGRLMGLVGRQDLEDALHQA